MDKTSTRYSSTSLRTKRSGRTTDIAILAPSAKSLAFIRQFARCYHTESCLTPALAGLILN